VNIDGKVLIPRQGNNSYIFPGVGLGAIASQAKRITDEMFLAAAKALDAQVTESELHQGAIYPALQRVREVSAKIATAVAEVAFKQGLAGRARPDNLNAYIESRMYDPEYRSYV
jgi:malate dehydrogenase (oxaloacetate-decarboxylating)(NADP+)